MIWIYRYSDFYPLKIARDMEDNNKASIIFQISGGNNQILPNATKAEQNDLY